MHQLTNNYLQLFIVRNFYLYLIRTLPSECESHDLGIMKRKPRYLSTKTNHILYSKYYYFWYKFFEFRLFFFRDFHEQKIPYLDVCLNI